MKFFPNIFTGPRPKVTPEGDRVPLVSPRESYAESNEEFATYDIDDHHPYSAISIGNSLINQCGRYAANRDYIAKLRTATAARLKQDDDERAALISELVVFHVRFHGDFPEGVECDREFCAAARRLLGEVPRETYEPPPARAGGTARG